MGDTSPTPLTVNCLDQVRVWISSDGLPAKHQARLARLRSMDFQARILLIVSLRWLEPSAAEALDVFAEQLDIEICDIATIAAVDDDEATILEHIHAEIDAHFAGPEDARGNLSVVSDQVRLLDFVLHRGLCTDMDIEFEAPLGARAATTLCPLGVIARHKANGCVGNDVTAGDPQGQAFQMARRGVAQLVRTYRAAACDHIAAEHGEAIATDEISRHQRFFELRGQYPPDPITGTERFSLTGGPDNFAIGLHQAGIACGYELGVARGLEPGELTPDHVPHVLNRADASGGRLVFRPFEFGAAAAERKRAQQRQQLWPPSLPAVICHWDHSWIPGHNAWRAITYRERLLLDLVNRPGWSIEDAASLLGPDPIRSCRRPIPLVTPDPDPLVVDRLDRRSAALVRIGEVASPPHVAQLAAEGVITVRGAIDGLTLSRLRSAFETEVEGKQGPTLLEQVSFNLAVDECERSTIELVRELALLPTLVTVADNFFGGQSRFVSARGYRQGPLPPVRYRAWDFHQDMKTNGPFEELKVMILLTDVLPEGQAMRFVCGSHLHRWRFHTQRETRFSLSEALELGGRGLFRGHGPAGTCVFFDTNGIHSGHRNRSAVRDVITLNFVRESPQAFHMFSDPVLTAPPASRTPVPPAASTLAWETPIINRNELQAMCADYQDTPELAATQRRWDGDALDLVDLIAADLNADLDLRVSERFEDDRLRDIGVVKLRDAAPGDDQYHEVVARIGGSSARLLPEAYGARRVHHGGAVVADRCPWDVEDPPAVAARHMDEVVRALSVRPDAESAICIAVLDDLSEAVRRCDGLARLRTTTAYSYVATAWAQRLLANAGGTSVEDLCCRLLHLYTHIVAENHRGSTIEGICLDG